MEGELGLNNPPDAHLILSLVGEGGGLKLYCLVTDGAIRFAWESAWQVLDEHGCEPVKTPGWKAKEYLSVADAVDGASSHWTFLAPTFVREDFRSMIWRLTSERLAESRMSPTRIEDALARWKRACHVA